MIDTLVQDYSDYQFFLESVFTICIFMVELGFETYDLREFASNHRYELLFQFIPV